VADFISYNDWLGANRDPTAASNALSKASAGSENAVGDAMRAGQAGQDPTSTASGQKLASYGDFLKQANTGNYSDLAGALGGGATNFDAMVVKGNDAGQLAQAQQAYNQQAGAVGQAYQRGSTQAQRQQQANTAINPNTGLPYGATERAAALKDQVAAGKQAQQAARDAGARYRLAREREGFEKAQKDRGNTLRAVSDVLNPIGGLADMAGEWNRGLGGNDNTVFGKGAAFVQDPLGLGGNAHSGFGPGGKFGSPLGMGDASQGDPLGMYSNDDSGFQAWLAKNGYSSTGEGNGY
jgi:hypothetical protein